MITYSSDWNEFVSNNYDELKFYCSCLWKNMNDDLFHNFLLKLKDLRLLEKFDNKKCKFPTYLRVILKSCGIQEQRKDRISKEYVPIDPTFTISGFMEPVNYSDLLDKVPEQYREIVDLLADGYNQSEIARMLGVSKQYINLRFKELRSKMLERGYETL